MNDISREVRGGNARRDRIESQANDAVQPIRGVAAPSSRSQSGQLVPVSRYQSSQISDGGLDGATPLLIDN